MLARHWLSLALLGAATSSVACAPPLASAPHSPILPLRTVRLYETGVGYFERTGAMDPGAPTSLPVPSGHLDDALKTLVVLGSKGQSHVHGIEWSSSISRGMARAVAGLPADGAKPTRLQELLAGLKGARVEADTEKGVIVGRLVDFAEAPAPAEDGGKAGDAKAPEPKLTLLILSDRGAILRVEGTALRSLRPLDPTYAARLGSALDALGSHVAESERLLEVRSAGGPVTLGYVAETPVWRTTYRLITGAPGASATLQGWALVHNDTDEDWRGVRVSLANGRPDSFLFPLAAPRYTRRPLVTPDDQLATVPQLMGTTVDAIWGDHLDDASGSGGLGLSGVGDGGGGRGEGIGLGSIGTLGHGAGTGTGTSTLLSVGNLSAVASADGVQTGAQFVYSLPEAVDLRGHGSALLPFVDGAVDAHPVTWFDDAGAEPRTALRFVNSTRQTLPAGTIAFFEEGGFAGESGLDRLKPGERRFLTYGYDLDVELHAIRSDVSESPQRLVYDAATDRLEEHYLRTSDNTYAVEDRRGTPRTVVIGTKLHSNATVTGTDEVDFDEVSRRPLLVFKLAGARRVERSVHTVEGLVRTFASTELTVAKLAPIVASSSLSAPDRAAGDAATARLREAEAYDATKSKLDADVKELTHDIERLREDMKAAGEQKSAQANPFAARVLSAEDKLRDLREKGQAAEKAAKSSRAAARGELLRLVRHA